MLTTKAGVFAAIPVDTAASTYAFVAVSVGLVTVPSIVIILVAKLPDPSRTTILPGISVLEIVANLALLIVALVISALTINELDKFPEESLCTTPAVVNASIEITPLEDIAIRSTALVLIDKLSAIGADNPVVVLPVNTNDGDAVVPAGNSNEPVII